MGPSGLRLRRLQNSVNQCLRTSQAPAARALHGRPQCTRTASPHGCPTPAHMLALRYSLSVHPPMCKRALPNRLAGTVTSTTWPGSA